MSDIAHKTVKGAEHRLLRHRPMPPRRRGRCQPRTLLLALAFALAPGGAVLVHAAATSAAAQREGHSDAGVLQAIQQTKLTAGDGVANDEFGAWVAVSGDTAVVSAPSGAKRFLDPNGEARGSVYVFVRSGTSWSQQAEFKAADYVMWSDDLDTYDFGSAAISGDTVLVAVQETHFTSPVQSWVYVFVRSGTSWTRQAVLSADGGGGSFGAGTTISSLAVSGDTALVRADWYDEQTDQSQSSAYVFTRSGGGWSQQAKITVSDANHPLSFSCALSGDTALLGACGAAFVFQRSGASWTQEAVLTTKDTDPQDSFGKWSVALSGDTAVVGADEVLLNESDEGAAYVFVRSGSSWSRQARLTGDFGFGRSVAISGDIALAASHHCAGVFVRTATRWILQTWLYAHDTAAALNKEIASVAFSGDTALLGAPGGLQDGGDVVPSSVYVFKGIVPGRLSTVKLTLKLSGLKSGALTLGKRLTAKGTVTPKSLAGTKVTLTVQRKSGTKWLRVTSKACTTSAGGSYSWSYKPSKRGTYRLRATIAKTAVHTAATTKWLTFKVK